MSAPPPHWHYDSLRTEQRLDPRDIENQGLFQLHRGLNIRRLVVFLGSGVSSAYGRISWGELGIVTIEGVLEALEDLNKTAYPEIVQMLKRLGDVKTAIEHQSGGDLITIALHLVERIFMAATESVTPETIERLAKEIRDAEDARKNGESRKEEAPIHRLIGRFKLEKPFRGFRRARIDGPELGRQLFRRVIREQTYDETAYIRRIMSDRPGAPEPDAVDQAARRLVNNDLDRFRRDLKLKNTRLWMERAKFRQGQEIYDAFKDVNDTFGANPSAYARLANEIMELLKNAAEDERNARYFGSRYWHLLAIAVDTLRLAKQLPSSDSEKIEVFLRSVATLLPDKDEQTPVEIYKIPEGDQRETPPEHDPLWRLSMDLGVTRFATLNYDLEVERLFQDIGLRPTNFAEQSHFAELDVERLGPLGGRARDFVVNEKSIADFIDFGVEISPYEFQVAHLHGRSTDDSDIIVTERDYQKAYVGDTPQIHAFNSGFQILFGSNPILFVGVGLHEGDVMRPLRYFVAGNMRRNQAIIALRDASGTEEDIDRFIVEQFVKNGVYVLHYGYLEKDKKRTGSWLHLFSKLCKALKDFLKTSCDEELNADELSEIKGKFKDFDDLIPDSKSFYSDGIEKCDISVEIATLKAIYGFAKHRRSGEPEEAEGANKPLKDFVSKTLVLDIDRTLNAAMTIALNARLERLRRDWTEWWEEWRAPIAVRCVNKDLRALPDQLRPPCDRDQVNNQALEKLYEYRHARHVVLGPPDVTEISPFMRDFLANIPELDGDEARLFVLVSPRGSGTGSNMTEFPRYADWILDRAGPIATGVNPPVHGNVPPAKRYAGFYMANFSTSPQIDNVLDDLIEFLSTRRTDNVENASFTDLADIGRIARLRAALMQLPTNITTVARSLNEKFKCHRLEPVQPRFLVVLHGTQHMFDLDGSPKNVQIRAVFDLLFDGATRTHLDLVIIVQDTLIPSYFRKRRSEPESEADCDHGRGRDFRLLLSRRDIDEDPDNLAKQRQDYILQVLQNGEIGLGEPVFASNDTTPQHVAGFCEDLKKFQTASTRSRNFLRVIHRVYSSDLEHSHKIELGNFENFLTLSDENNNGEETKKNATSQNYPQTELFLKNCLASSRYSLILLLAIVGKDAPLPKEKRKKLKRLFDALTRHPIVRSEGPSNAFFELVLDHWWGQEEPLGCSITCETCVNSHDSKCKVEEFVHDVDKMGNPKVEEPSCGDVSERPSTCRKAMDSRLHQELLRDIAIISMPVTADILVGSPNVAASCRRLLAGLPDGLKFEQEAKKLVRNALCVLWSRRLLLLLQPNRSRDDGSQAEPRFVVHRSLQRYVFRKLGSQETEPPQNYSFGVSLYASQVREIPMLSANGYAFLNELVDSLVCFPSRAFSQKLDVLFDGARLRAALGICKTLYSIGVVSRFADLPGLERPTPPKIGYFEHHRLMMRWLLHCAKENDAKERSALLQASKKSKASPNRPFYRDEIVWLYNECGLFSLAQGHIFDARALFASAKREARKIEGPLGGPTLRRVRLNAALASLEGGNIPGAESDLLSICKDEDEYSRIRAIAEGYLGLVHHWKGNLESAEKRYSAAIDTLSKEGRLRAQSIFLRHRGTLRRRQLRVPAAISDFESAIETAAAGGFQDLFWLARVDKANLDVTIHKENLSDLALRDSVIKILEEADHYADKMDIPRLACQVSGVRGKLLMLQGETSRATELVTRALRIATLSGLVIRSITFRMRLAEILDRSSLGAQADRVRMQARSAARRLSYRALDEPFN